MNDSWTLETFLQINDFSKGLLGDRLEFKDCEPPKDNIIFHLLRRKKISYRYISTTGTVTAFRTRLARACETENWLGWESHETRFITPSDPYSKLTLPSAHSTRVGSRAPTTSDLLRPNFTCPRTHPEDLAMLSHQPLGTGIPEYSCPPPDVALHSYHPAYPTRYAS